MSMRGRVLTIGAALALAGMLSAGAWAFLYAGRRSVRLPDGSRLTLENVTYDRAPPPVVFGPEWQRRLYPLLPSPYRARLQWPVIQASEEASRGAQVTTLVHFSPTVDYPEGVLIDSHGCELWADSLSMYADGKVNIQGFPFFPRREESFLLRTRYVGPFDFRIANPLPTRHPEWTPEPFPATRTSRGVSFTLTDLKAGLSNGAQVLQRRETPAQPLEYCCIGGAYRVTQLGGPANDWRPLSLAVSDAGGGSREYSEHDLRRPANGVFYFHGGLCRRETYRLRIEFSRFRSPRAAPDAVWTVRGVPLQARGVRVRPGVTMRLGSYGAAALGGITTADRALRFRLRATDDRGRPCPAVSERYDSGPMTRVFTVKHEADARLLDFRIEVFRSRYAEFTVRPTWAR
jgi:hypothetical protein